PLPISPGRARRDTPWPWAHRTIGPRPRGPRAEATGRLLGPLGALLLELFGLERLLNGRPCGHALEVGLDARPLGEVDARELRPAEDRVEVRVRRREGVTEEVR